MSVHDGEDIGGNAEDPPAEDASIDVTIEVTDVNEPPAFADDAPTTLEVAENTAADTDITDGAFPATDPDNNGTNSDKDTLTYSLGGTDAASFDIDTPTGQLKTKADLDFETKASYSVDVQVSDGRNAEGAIETPPMVDATHSLTITVTDADDPGSITLSSQEPTVGSALTATVVDQDGTVSGETWEWESLTDQNTWTPISDETTNSYTPVASDEGNHLRGDGHLHRWPRLWQEGPSGDQQRGGPKAGNEREPVIRRRDGHPRSPREHGGGHEHRRAGVSHSRRQQGHAGIRPGRHGCRVLRHRHGNRSAENQGRPRLRGPLRAYTVTVSVQRWSWTAIRKRRTRRRTTQLTVTINGDQHRHPRGSRGSRRSPQLPARQRD